MLLIGLLIFTLPDWAFQEPLVFGPNPFRDGEPLVQNRLYLPDRLELPAFNFHEIVPSVAVAIPARHDLRDPGHLRTLVTRTVPILWQMLMDTDAPISHFEISLELTAANGRKGYLSLPEDPQSEIAVRLKTTPITVLSRGINDMVVGGGMALELQIGGARMAGTYSGSLLVTIHGL